MSSMCVKVSFSGASSRRGLAQLRHELHAREGMRVVSVSPGQIELRCEDDVIRSAEIASAVSRAGGSVQSLETH